MSVKGLCDAAGDVTLGVPSYEILADASFNSAGGGGSIELYKAESNEPSFIPDSDLKGGSDIGE